MIEMNEREFRALVFSARKNSGPRSLSLLKNFEEDPFISICNGCKFATTIHAVIANLRHDFLDIRVSVKLRDALEAACL